MEASWLIPERRIIKRNNHSVKNDHLVVPANYSQDCGKDIRLKRTSLVLDDQDFSSSA
jgi:hypothetical protein